MNSRFAKYVCPCCNNNLLRHVNRRQVYWFCFRCRQTMPAIEQQKHQ